MPHGEGIVRAFLPFWEPAQASLGADGIQLIQPPGENLVGIGLMAHIPHNGIPRNIKHPMQCHSQFHNSQVGGKVTAVGCHRMDDFVSDFFAESLHLGNAQPL